jgi:hypothetical protein
MNKQTIKHIWNAVNSELLLAFAGQYTADLARFVTAYRLTEQGIKNGLELCNSYAIKTELNDPGSTANGGTNWNIWDEYYFTLEKLLPLCRHTF